MQFALSLLGLYQLMMQWRSWMYGNDSIEKV